VSVLAELKRRNVVRVAALYGLAAWLILQVADVLVPALGLPGWVMRLVALLLILGFPLALIFSWVYELTPEGLKKQLEVDRNPSITHETGRKFNYLIGVLAVVAIVVVAVERFIPRAEPVPAATNGTPGAPPAEKPVQAAAQSIAVLPFTNLTGDPGQDIVADGLAEEVANQLAAVPELRVTGRASSFSFKGRNEDLRVIAKQLDVANLLEGTLSVDGTRLRVTVQLIDGRDGTRRWSSRPYEHEQSGILAAQDKIAQDVARALSVTLDVGALNRAQGGTMNLEAARRYWEWRELQLSDSGGLELARRNVRLMREAVRLDPQFAVAWDGLAGSLRTLAYYVGEKEPQQAEQLRAEAEQAWRRVAELAPGSWVALKKRSHNLLRAEKWAESEAVARQMLESGPFTLERVQPLNNVLFATGRFDEGIELAAQVIAIEPRVMFASRDQQWNLYIAGRFEELEAEYQRSQTLDGSHSDPNFLALMRALARQDADPRALRELFQQAWSEDEKPPQWWHDFGAAIPNRQAMLAVLRRAFEAGEDADFVLADALGDRDLALTILRSSLTHHRGQTNTWWWPWMLVHSGVRADPRFKELMREAGLADYWRQSGKWPDLCGPVGEDDFECQ
jgi:TolB-like protein